MEKSVLEDMTTRRKSPRVNCHWGGRFQNTQRQTARVTVKNISMGGLGINTRMLLRKGDKVLLEFKAIHEQKACSIRAICTVAFVVVKGDGYDVGLQFSSDMQAYRDFLTSYINGRTVGE